MARLSIAMVATVLLAGLTPSRVMSQQTPANPLPTFEDQVSYALGLNMAKEMVAEKLPIKPDLLARGISDGFGKGKALLTDDQVRDVLTRFYQNQQALAESNAKAAGDKALQEGQAFLAANKSKPGVQTTMSGLQYQVLKAANGPSPKATDTVRVHYHGTLVDGTVFDSSVQRNEPATFPVNRVISGWTEALQKMKVGEKWRLFIPSDLAYGPRGTPGGPIPPNATLLFDVELLEIVKQ